MNPSLSPPSTSARRPSLHETALGCFLHDIGKLLQRAGGAQSNLPPEVRSRASDILPCYKGRHTHIHALWSDLFFEQHSRIFPGGINASQVRRVAVYHHKPDSAWSELCAIADRTASGMDRKEKDEQSDPALNEQTGWDAFIKTPLKSCYTCVQLPEKPAAPDMVLPLTPFDPATPPMPLKPDRLRTEGLPGDYKRLRDEFAGSLNLLADEDMGIPVFCEAMLSLSERYLSAVPSSTKDQPDISLHDHARATAAVGAALYGFHEAQGTLEDRGRIGDRREKKFIWVAGDLSGIQSSLFRLANHTTILRAFCSDDSQMMIAPSARMMLLPRPDVQKTPFSDDR